MVLHKHCLKSVEFFSFSMKDTFFPINTLAAKLAKKPLTHLKLTFSMFSTFLCQASHKLDQASSQVTASAAWLGKCFCKAKEETKKGGNRKKPSCSKLSSIFRQLHSKHMPGTISSRKCWFGFHYLFIFSTEALHPNLVCNGGKAETPS